MKRSVARRRRTGATDPSAVPLLEPDKIVQQWPVTMETGLRIGAETMKVEFPNESAPATPPDATNREGWQ